MTAEDRIKQAMSIAVATILLVLTAIVSQAQSVKQVAGYYKRGVERFQKGDLEGAINLFDKVIEGSLADTKAFETGNKEDILILEFGGLLVPIPRAAAAYFARGMARMQKGELDDALTDFDRSLEIAPRNAEAWLNRGVAKHRKGELDEALADFNQAIATYPRHETALYNRGVILFARNETDKALADFDKTLSINPRNAEAYLNGSALRN